MKKAVEDSFCVFMLENSKIGGGNRNGTGYFRSQDPVRISHRCAFSGKISAHRDHFSQLDRYGPDHRSMYLADP